MHPLIQHLLSILFPIYSTTYASIHPCIIHPSVHHPNTHHLPTPQPISPASDGDEFNRLGFSREAEAEVLKPWGFGKGVIDPKEFFESSIASISPQTTTEGLPSSDLCSDKRFVLNSV